MRDLGEACGWGRADLPRRAVATDQFRKARLERSIALTQRVVLGMGNVRRRIGVIKPVVTSDFVGEFGQFVARFFLGQGVDRRQFGGCAAAMPRRAHAWRPAIRLAAAARASAVMVWPDSIRAISSCLLSRSSSSTRVTVLRWSRRFATRQ